MKKFSIPILLTTALLFIFILVILMKAPFLKPKSQVTAAPEQTNTEVTPQPDNSSTEEQSEALPTPEPKTPPKNIKGIYVTSWIAGSQRMNDIVQFIKDNKTVNAVVIDVKDDTGIISYPTEIPLAKEIGASSRRAPKLKELVAELNRNGIYTIARIVVFKDPLLASKHLELAVKDKNGGNWRDRKGMVWVDPHCQKIWQYNLEIAKEAVAMGFSEVQFDYVRFISDGKISNAVYPFSKGESKEDVIRNFLAYCKAELLKSNTPVSADIFGLVLSVPDDLNIGQKLEKITDVVDYISPMVYPSHYPKGTFEIDNPDRYPYETIFNAMKDGLKRVPGSKVKFRPWLQDFDLGNSYGREQLQAQIKALADHGIHDWLFWNPSNRYDQTKYDLE